MKNLLFGILALLLAACSTPSSPEEGKWIVQPPAGVKPVRIDKAGETVLPNGRLITPYGQTIPVAPHPFGLALSPDGKVAVTANSGIRPFSISILDGVDSGRPTVRQIPEGAQNDEG
ncbi:MAG TPA: hypothetical protein PLU64_15910, partial [Saprospiraceae bacterium]|nr:hypothetical protein [Saprospiraceae bacterium]